VTVAIVDQERDVFLEYGARVTDVLPEITDDPAPALLFEAMSRRLALEKTEPEEPDAV
jgi:hypothetical protein